jgi:hypothetical protein
MRIYIFRCKYMYIYVNTHKSLYACICLYICTYEYEGYPLGERNRHNHGMCIDHKFKYSNMSIYISRHTYIKIYICIFVNSHKYVYFCIDKPLSVSTDRLAAFICAYLY